MVFFFWGKGGVTIKNCNISDFSFGILMSNSQNNKIIGNNISNTYEGIRLDNYSSDNELTQNNSLNNFYYGIMLTYHSSNNYLRNNAMLNNKYNFGVWGWEKESYIQDIDTSNTVDGKPIYYLVNQQGIVIDETSNAGYVGVVNSERITVKNLTLKNNFQQVLFVNTENSMIENVNIYDSYYSIYLHSSSNNEIIKNYISNIYGGFGIYVGGELSESNSITENDLRNSGIVIVGAANNKIERNNSPDIYLYKSFNNVITENNLLNNNYGGGIILHLSSSTTVSRNIGSNNAYGIYLSGSSNNNIIENSFSKNWRWGIYLTSSYEQEGLIESKNNKIYHNNFIDNRENANSFYAPENIWDDGYPSGGNYWSDYVGLDEKIGPNQDQPGNDGIGDTPYTFTGGKDRYPFMKKDGWINQPPTFSNLNQYKSDGLTVINEGKTTTDSTIIFKAIVSDPDNDQIKLEVELRKFQEPFTGIYDGGILSSNFVDSGSVAIITRYGLVNGQYKWRARAIDSRGAVSEWQEFGVVGNVDFEVKLVPLYTQIYSPYPSWAETDEWDDLPYGTGNYSDCSDAELGYSAIRNCGCAITSEVMILRFHGVTTAIDGNKVDPRTFNEWLANPTNDGYWSDGSVKWEKIQEYSRDEFGFARVVYDGPIDYKDNTTLDLYLDDLHPIILYEKVLVQGELQSHYIVADGKLTTTYTIKDPAFYNTRKLSQPAGSYARNYNNYFYGLRLFHPALATYGVDSISFNLASPAELLVTDPQGRKLGKDPINDISYNEIPGGVYYQEGIGNPFPGVPTPTKESKFTWIPNPLDGQYDIQVIGTEAESYTIELLAYDQNGNPKDIIYQASTAANIIQTFELNYSKENIQKAESYRIIDIDIKPSSYPNSINLKSKSVTPVAVLTDSFFDASDIIINSIIFAGANPTKGNLEDVDKDNDLDLILYFNTKSLQLDPASTEAILTARLKDNVLIKGIDSVRIVTNQKLQKDFFLALLRVPTVLYQQFRTFLHELTSILIRIWRFLSNSFDRLIGRLEEISHEPCLLDNEIANYEIIKRKDEVSLANIFIKNKETNKEVFSFQIELPIPDHYHPIEFHKCGIYATRSFNYDYIKKQAIPNYRIELWRYFYNSFGRSIIFLSGPVSGTGFGTDFRVDPTEIYLVLERSYLGNSDYALVIKNLETKEDVFVLPLKDIVDKYPDLEGSIGFNEWTKNGRYFWANIFYSANVLGFIRIDTSNWAYDVLPAPRDVLGGDGLNVENGYITVHPGNVWLGITELLEEEKAKRRAQGIGTELYIENLFTKEHRLIDKTDEPLWYFKPKWISNIELEYYMPSGERKVYNLESK